MLPVAVAVAASPFPIIAVVLVLLSPTGAPAGAAFVLGRVVGVAVIVGVFATLSDLIETSGETSRANAVLRIVLGLALMLFSVRKWRKRPSAEDEAELPGWMRTIEGGSPARAAVSALVLSVANPKELLLGVSAGITIGSAGLPLAATLATAAAYTAVACISVVIPVVCFVLARDRTRTSLERLRTTLIQHNAAIIAVVMLVIGGVLIGGGLSAI